jgi:hypothetical protein
MLLFIPHMHTCVAKRSGTSFLVHVFRVLRSYFFHLDVLHGDVLPCMPILTLAGCDEEGMALLPFCSIAVAPPIGVASTIVDAHRPPGQTRKCAPLFAQVSSFHIRCCDRDLGRK